MTVEELGKEGEQKARKILKTAGYWVGQIDWLGKKDGKWIKFEIKRKERFEPPPFEGHGLNAIQVNFARELYLDTGIRTMLVIWEKGTNKWFAQWLDILETRPNDEKYLTRNNIRIYKLTNFVEWENIL